MTLSWRALLGLCIGFLFLTPAANARVRDLLQRPDSWFESAEGINAAQNILSWQTPDGLWPKNVDTAAKPWAGDKEQQQGTFDNGATTDELRFLARAFKCRHESRLRNAFLKGFAGILAAQYPTGGWPQIYPPPATTYHRHITFNDGAMVRVLEFLREVSAPGEYDFLSPRDKQAARTAFERGVECILNCQVKVHGKLTAWCAQHDEQNLQPRPGRSYELVSLSGSESVGIVRLLMSIENPDERVVKSVEAAVAWFRAARIEGIRLETVPAPELPKGVDRVVVKDPQAPPMWARFHDIGSNAAIFSGRDGTRKDSLAEIEHERRTGYAWLGYWPDRLLHHDYPAWRKQLTLAASPTPKGARLERTNLLAWRDSAGVVRPVTTTKEWQYRRAEILAGAQKIMGPLPGSEKRCPLEMTVEAEVDCGSYVRRLITYASEPGSRVPAYLLVPKQALQGTRCPAVLCLHPTDNVLGHKVVVGLGGKENRQYAAELAERGYVTLAPSYPQLAAYQPDLDKLGYASGTMKAIWDNIRGLDLLASLPYVQLGGFGAIGHSLGGHNAVYTAVFDPRIKVVVSSCGLDSYLDYYPGNARMWEPGQGWTQTRYMPRLAAFRGKLGEIPFDFHELIGTLAPRVCFISAPKRDSNFNWESVDRIASAAAPVFALYGAGKNLVVEHPECEHDFPDAMREEAYLLFESHLKPK